MIFFVYLYFEISYEPIWIYIIIGLLISIVQNIGISKIQTPYYAIKGNNCMVIEAPMISNRKILMVESENLIPHSVLEKTVRPGDVRHYNYYVRVNIDGKIMEIEYKGKEFDYLAIGDEMLIIEFKNGKKEVEYMYFSNREING